MRRSVVLLVVALFHLQAATPVLPQEAAGAGPFWEARPYGEWKAPELIQFFIESPWSRPATLLEPTTQTTLGAPRYVVQWYSAQTMREALVRRQELAGQIDAQAARDFLNAPHAAYEVYIFAAVLTADGSLRVVDADALDGMTEKEIQQGSLLQFSAQEYSSRPDGVQLVRDVKTNDLRGVRLVFARARGAVPPEQAGAGQVQLTCGTKHGSLSVRFSLSAMQRDGKPDL